MGFLPIFLDLGERPCIVIGGGQVAERKVRELLEAGAAVTIVSPTLTTELDELRQSRRVTYFERPYSQGDLAGFVLAFAATGDRAVDAHIAAEARERGVLLNVADVPELCDFIAPATVKRGALRIAISTSGASPAFASRLRRELEDQFGSEYAIALEILRAARGRLRDIEPRRESRAKRLDALANAPLAQLIRAGDWAAIDALLLREIGDGLGGLGLGEFAAAASAQGSRRS